MSTFQIRPGDGTVRTWTEFNTVTMPNDFELEDIQITPRRFEDVRVLFTVSAKRKSGEIVSKEIQLTAMPELSHQANLDLLSKLIIDTLLELSIVGVNP